MRRYATQLCSRGWSLDILNRAKNGYAAFWLIASWRLARNWPGVEEQSDDTPELMPKYETTLEGSHHPAVWPRVWHPSDSGVQTSLRCQPGGCRSLNPRLISGRPPGCTRLKPGIRLA